MDTIADLAPSWERDLRARNLAPRTIASYLEAAHDLDSWLTAERAAPIPLGEICHSDITGYIGGILDRASASYAATKYRRLQQFFRWALGEGEIDDSPMRRLSPPRVPDKPVPVIDGTTVRSLLAACEGRRFEDRRDTAILRTLLDTGVRSAELVGLTLETVDFDYSVVVVLGKGRKLRSVPFGAKTSQALDRYLRVRRHHKWAEQPWLWLGAKGRLTASGVQQMLDRRTRRAGLPHIHLHQWRHTAAHEWLANDGQEGDLMRLMGWTSADMTRRYAKSSADVRAREAHKRMGLGDRY